MTLEEAGYISQSTQRLLLRDKLISASRELRDVCLIICLPMLFGDEATSRLHSEKTINIPFGGVTLVLAVLGRFAS